jgi:hypothetical protein
MEKAGAMKTRTIISLLIYTALGAGTLFGVQDDRPHVGVMLDPQPLPDLLVKHLRLAEGEGTRVANVVVGGAGDEAGLERDDIIVGFEGVKIDGAEMLIEELKKHRIGQEAELEIIHLGQRKVIKLRLGASADKIKWKYPVEPSSEVQWQPGTVYRLDPDEEGWIPIPFDELVPPPGAFGKGKKDITKLFGECYSFRYCEGGKEYQVTIEGDPRDENTVVTVRIGTEENQVTVKEVDTLPEEYRKSAVDALEKAKKARAHGSISIQVKPGGTGLSDTPTISDVPWPPSGSNGERLDRIEKRLQQLQRRLEQLESRRHSRQDETREEQLMEKQRGSSNTIGVGIMIEGREKT